MATPLHKKVMNRIRFDFILNGRVVAGARLPGARELARLYGVAVTTVVHALNEMELEGWINKRRGSGCYVTRQALMSRPEMLGLVAYSPKNETVLRFYQGVERAARRREMHVVMANSDGGYELEHLQVKRLVEAGCRALVILPTTRTRKQMARDYLRTEFRDIPIVLVDIAYPEQRRASVLFDNYQAGYDMTEYIVKQGCKRIAFMDIADADETNLLMHRSTKERYQGYRDALRDLGIVFHREDVLMVDDLMFQTDPTSMLIAFLRRVQQEPEPVDALISLYDPWAVMCIRLAREMGIKIPGQLLVTGFDNLTMPGYPRDFVTTSPDFRRAGELAVRLAVELTVTRQNTLPSYVLPVPLLIPPPPVAVEPTTEAPAAEPTQPG